MTHNPTDRLRPTANGSYLRPPRRRAAGRLPGMLLAVGALWSCCAQDLPTPTATAAIAPAVLALPAAERRTVDTPPAPSPSFTLPPQRRLQQGPFLRLSDTLWDWGIAPSGEELRHIFVLHNDGDQPVHIRKARPT